MYIDPKYAVFLRKDRLKTLPVRGGQILYSIRAFKRVQRSAVAVKIELSLEEVERAEAGIIWPKFDELVDWLDFLGCTLAEFFYLVNHCSLKDLYWDC